jgi:drug/metabolite transporter (DMT)-like permease
MGILLIVYVDFGAKSTTIIGDLLAICSAILVALYLLIARYHRDETDFIKYLIIVYGTAALICSLYMIISGNTFVGYSTTAWIMMILLALGPNLLGHSLLNWSSRHLEIFKVNLTLQLEPVLATIAGMIFFFEYPSNTFYLGAGLILFSIGYLFYAEK